MVNEVSIGYCFCYGVMDGCEDFYAWVLAFCIGFSFVLDCFMPKALDSFVGLTCKDKSKKDVAVSDSKAK